MFKIRSIRKTDGDKRFGIGSFKSQKAANDHLELLAELAEIHERHKHFFLYDYEVVNTKQSKK